MLAVAALAALLAVLSPTLARARVPSRA
jgi:hypothetical protein